MLGAQTLSTGDFFLKDYHEKEVAHDKKEYLCRYLLLQVFEIISIVLNCLPLHLATFFCFLEELLPPNRLHGSTAPLSRRALSAQTCTVTKNDCTPSQRPISFRGTTPTCRRPPPAAAAPLRSNKKQRRKAQTC